MYDVQSIYEEKIKKVLKSIPGVNIIMSYNEKFIYITSKENTYSIIFLYDFSLNLIANQKIVNMYGRPITFFNMDYCHPLDKEFCDPALMDKKRLVLSVENNMIFI